MYWNVTLITLHLNAQKLRVDAGLDWQALFWGGSTLNRWGLPCCSVCMINLNL